MAIPKAPLVREAAENRDWYRKEEDINRAIVLKAATVSCECAATGDDWAAGRGQKPERSRTRLSRAVGSRRRKAIETVQPQVFIASEMSSPIRPQAALGVVVAMPYFSTLN